MDWNGLNLAVDYYHGLLSAELHVNEWVQESLGVASPLFRFISVSLEPGNMLNVLVPLLGICCQDLLIKLLYVLGLVNAVSSFEKWIYPELRPLWWLRELYATDRVNRPRVALESHNLSCETSGGLPCAHSMSCTVFLLIICARLKISARSGHCRLAAYSVLASCLLCLWLSRLYLATEFMHQCILGSYIAVSIFSSCHRHLHYLYSRRCSWSVVFVCLLGCVAAAVYFIKLRFGLDPHWSVRQAFKWCPEPTYMRHEASPIFLLARDLGNLMGVALSLPLDELNKTRNSNYPRRFGGIAVLELINYILRLYTPKQNGRFVFLAYEFTRNALHSLLLIKFLPKLVNQNALSAKCS